MNSPEKENPNPPENDEQDSPNSWPAVILCSLLDILLTSQHDQNSRGSNLCDCLGPQGKKRANRFLLVIFSAFLLGLTLMCIDGIRKGKEAMLTPLIILWVIFLALALFQYFMTRSIKKKAACGPRLPEAPDDFDIPDNDLTRNLDKLNADDALLEDIRRTLSLDEDEDVIAYCADVLDMYEARFQKKGSLWTVKMYDCTFTVDADSYTLLSMTRRSGKKPRSTEGISLKAQKPVYKIVSLPRKNDLFACLDKLHASPGAKKRVQKKLELTDKDGEPVAYCRRVMKDENAVFKRAGHFWHVSVFDCVFIVEVFTYALITADLLGEAEESVRLKAWYEEAEEIFQSEYTSPIREAPAQKPVPQNDLPFAAHSETLSGGNDLLTHLDKLHVSGPSALEIRDALSLGFEDPAAGCRRIIGGPCVHFSLEGDIWTADAYDCVITVDASTYALLSARRK